MSVFVLKIIACVSMFLDHYKFILGNSDFVTMYLGRLAFPIYAFLISEGYCHTKNFAKYLGRLLLFAVISQLPAYLLFSPFLGNVPYLNIFFTLALGLIAIRFYDKVENKKIALLLILLTSFFGEIIHCDYGALGILLIATFYILKDKKNLLALSASALILVNYLSNITEISIRNLANIKQQFTLAFFAIFSLIFVFLYNGKLGKSNKYLKMFFYFFYPLHLLIFYIARLILI